MEDSILDSVKKILGIGPDDPSFDLDVLTHINSVFSDLNQFGVGPVEGYAIEDAGPVWADFLGEDHKRFNNVKTYTYLKVRVLFDPPATSFGIDAMTKQADELAWRITHAAESTV